MLVYIFILIAEAHILEMRDAGTWLARLEEKSEFLFLLLTKGHIARLIFWKPSYRVSKMRYSI
jgi:hypothetical protein